MRLTAWGPIGVAEKWLAELEGLDHVQVYLAGAHAAGDDALARLVAGTPREFRVIGPAWTLRIFPRARGFDRAVLYPAGGTDRPAIRSWEDVASTLPTFWQKVVAGKKPPLGCALGEPERMNRQKAARLTAEAGGGING